MKKFNAAMLIAVIVFSLCACAGTAQNAEVQATPQAAASAPAVTAATPAPAAASMYPIAGGVTLKYWRPINANITQYFTTFADNMAYQEVMKNTGVTLEFIHPTVGQEKAEFNLMVASGDLPDIMQVGSYYTGGIQQAYEDGLIIDITPYAQTMCPDWYGLIESNSEFQRQVYTEDEKLLFFCRAWYEGNSSYNRVAVNKEWWEASSDAEWPVTMDDYTGYFEYVKKTYPEAYGLGLLPENLLWYGAFNILDNWIVVDGETVNGNATEGYRDYLTQMNGWYVKGYITPEFASLDASGIQKQMGAKQLGTVTGAIDSIRAAALAGGIEIISCPLPRQNADSLLHCAERTEFMGGLETCVSSSSDHPGEAVQFLNYAYTDEGAMIHNYGIEGVTYTMEDGVPTYTDFVFKNAEVPLNSALNYFRIHDAPKLCPDGLKCNPAILGDPEGIKLRLLHTDDPNVNSEYRIPPIQLTADENTRRAEILTAMNTYIQEMRLKFIVGVEPLSGFDKYLNQLKALGYDEARQITQTAYDRYMSR